MKICGHGGVPGAGGWQTSALKYEAAQRTCTVRYRGSMYTIAYFSFHTYSGRNSLNCMGRYLHPRRLSSSDLLIYIFVKSLVHYVSLCTFPC